jgi:hypothetical protein
MKKQIAALALGVASLPCIAAGPVDGIYSCGVTVLGSVRQAYVTVSGHSDGTSVFTVAAVSPSQDFYGYGIGTATGTQFTGSTMLGQPFNFTVTPGGAISGTIRVPYSGIYTNASAYCAKIF